MVRVSSRGALFSDWMIPSLEGVSRENRATKESLVDHE